MDATVSAHGHSDAHSSAHQAETERKLRIGIFLYVLIDVTFVAALFASYIWLRTYNTQNLWLPDGVHGPSSSTTLILTGLLVASGLFYFVGDRAIRGDKQGLFKASMVLSLLFMIASLVGQYWFMGHLPFVTTDGAFASSFIMLSGYHLFHMLMVSLIGLGLINRVLHSRYTSKNTVGVRVIGYYWYWAVINGVALWLLLIVLPPTLS